MEPLKRSLKVGWSPPGLQAVGLGTLELLLGEDDVEAAVEVANVDVMAVLDSEDVVDEAELLEAVVTAVIVVDVELIMDVVLSD